MACLLVLTALLPEGLQEGVRLSRIHAGPAELLRQLEHSPGSAAVSADFSFDCLFQLEVSNGSQALLRKLPGQSLVRFGLFHSLSFCQPFSPKLIFLLSFFPKAFLCIERVHVP